MIRSGKMSLQITSGINTRIDFFIFQTGDRCALPFPRVICNAIEGCIEEGLWLQAVTIVTSNLSVSKFPPAELLHIIMQEIMQVSEEFRINLIQENEKNNFSKGVQ